jgi:hypothetical protein
MSTQKTKTTRRQPAFELGQRVRVITTGEVGEITQRCENATREPEYRVAIRIPLGHTVFRAVSEPDIEEPK